jgi:hypothetical protein
MPNEQATSTAQINQVQIKAVTPSGGKLKLLASQPVVMPQEAATNSLPMTASSLALWGLLGLLSLAMISASNGTPKSIVTPGSAPSTPTPVGGARRFLSRFQLCASFSHEDHLSLTGRRKVILVWASMLSCLQDCRPWDIARLESPKQRVISSRRATK